jgi:fatty acid amide hydrolase 2
MPNELLDASLSELADKLRSRKVSPVELVQVHIDRIGAVNGALNALVADRFEIALEEARAAEDVLTSNSTGELPPLFGIPCTIKEFISVEGMPHTAGLVARRGRVAQEDATVVERLRRAGAIVLGVSNVPEGGMWMETVNNVYGRTSNPWNRKRTSGGSSGGEAALVAAGASPFGIGSDIAGSIRIPAAFCGVVGHKPTGRMVPMTGHWGPADHGTGPFLVCGPICRYVGDVAPILSVIEGPDAIDPLTAKWPRVEPLALDEVVVFTAGSSAPIRAGKTMRRSLEQVAQALQARGATLRTLESKRLKSAFRIWAVAMSEASGGEAGPTFDEILAEGEPIALWRELAKSTVGRSRYTFPALGLAALERLGERLPKSLVSGVASVEELRAELEDTLGPNGVLLMPPYTRPAPRHRAALLTPFDFIGTGVFSIVEFPVTQVPTGFDRQGLPIGVQIAARRGNDRLTLAVAQAIEEDFGSWVRAEP